MYTKPGPDEEGYEETQFYCARCRASKDLYTLEQKNPQHEVIGVIFVCSACADNLTGKQMEIRFGDEPFENQKDIYMDELERVEMDGMETWN